MQFIGSTTAEVNLGFRVSVYPVTTMNPSIMVHLFLVPFGKITVLVPKL